MPSYQTLDTIADAYLPVLGILQLWLIVAALRHKAWRQAAVLTVMVLGGLVIAYGMMFIDQTYLLWQRLGLDYSTHTAVALVLVSAWAVYNQRGRLIGPLSLFLYCLLMLFQHYHTPADILSTAAIIGLLDMPVIRYTVRTLAPPRA